MSDLEPKRFRVGDSPLVALTGVVGFLVACVSSLYSVFGVKWQTDQNTAEIQQTKAWVLNHDKGDREHAALEEQKLEHISEQLNQAIGKLDEIDKRIK